MTTSLDSQIQPQFRDKLFFDQYRYSMRFRFQHSGRMRVLTSKAIRDSFAYSARFRFNEIVTPECIERAVALGDLINAIDVPYKRIVYTDWQYFYSNHTDFFEAIEAMPGVSHVSYSSAEITLPRDTVVLKNSDYPWRTYFKDRWYYTEETQLFCNFLLSRPQQFKITNYQRQRMQRNHFYITRSLFVDHHDPGDALMLNMVLPNCVRKTLPIVEKQ